MELNSAQLKSDVTVVVTEFDAAERAAEAELAAKSELLSNVIQLVKPALRAIGTKPQLSRRWVGRRDDVTRYTKRCVALSCDQPMVGPERDSDNYSDTRGGFEGQDLLLREDGAIVELTYTGSWSNWQGETSSWTATVKEYASVEEAMADGWDNVELYVSCIVDAVAAAKGSREKSTKKAIERAEKLAALAALLKF